MELISRFDTGEIASTFVGRTSLGNEVEFVESTQPPLSRAEKETLVISTMLGCPVGCKMCDAGTFYRGKLAAEEMLEQIDYVVLQRYGERRVPAKKFKIQFSRMGEPSLNEEVLKVLDMLPRIYDAPGLLPSLSSTAPFGRQPFFEELLRIKNTHYRGRFQLQFSIHSTDFDQRKLIVPIKKWSFEEINAFGTRFKEPGDKKVTLNFAIARENIIEAAAVRRYFDPEVFIIKITPLNPSYNAVVNGLSTGVDADRSVLTAHPQLIDALQGHGFEVILSIGEQSENRIGSNCGQLVRRHLVSENKIDFGYQDVQVGDLQVSAAATP